MAKLRRKKEQKIYIKTITVGYSCKTKKVEKEFLISNLKLPNCRGING